jgi:hypothetical protein
MKYLFSTVLILCTIMGHGQQKWYGQLTLGSIDCDNYQACYDLNIKGINGDSWALGDQNYRLFYDAERISIEGVKSLLPAAKYSNAQLDEDLTIAGRGQEDFSPLDKIDTHLGFLDFNIISYSKQDPSAAVQVKKEEFTPVAEICIQVDPEMFDKKDEEHAVKMYFSRPSTAGQITSQYSVVSQIHEPNRSCATDAVGFVDLDFGTGDDARLAIACEKIAAEKEGREWVEKNKLRLYPNPAIAGQQVVYESLLSQNEAHEVLIYNELGGIVSTYKDLPAGNREVTEEVVIMRL